MTKALYAVHYAVVKSAGPVPVGTYGGTCTGTKFSTDGYLIYSKLTMTVILVYTGASGV